MHIQLWSYNYDPEPTGIAPVSTVWAEAMQELGHTVEVVAAHPHYPTPIWGRRRFPYRETRNGVRVLRLPLWVGRETGSQRVVQELSYATAQTLALPALRSPDLIVSVSPSFPALAPALANVRLRRVPWVVWIQDLLPDGAVTTGLVESGLVLSMARKLELATYRSANRIVVVSESFRQNILAKGVPPEKVALVYNPATRPLAESSGAQPAGDALRVLTMGNIGHSQGLTSLVQAFESSDLVRQSGHELVIAGDGVAAAELREAIRSSQVKMLGLVSSQQLDQELRAAAVGLVSQRPDIAEFNLPSKLMNYLAYGVPVLAAVRPGTEVARLVEASGAGWVVDSSTPEAFPERLAELLGSPGERERLSRAGLEFARQHLTPEALARRFAELLDEARSDLAGDQPVSTLRASKSERKPTSRVSRRGRSRT